MARYVPCGDHDTYKFVQFYTVIRERFVGVSFGTYNSGVSNLTLGGLPVPVDCDFISPIRNVLVPSLGVSQPSAQMFLVWDQLAIIAVICNHRH